MTSEEIAQIVDELAQGYDVEVLNDTIVWSE